MKKTLSVLLLSFFTITWAAAQQTPRVLTPAEQKQKEKIDREVQRERQIRAEWLQKQRDYEAKQAEKERQKQAKKAAKELPKEAPQAKPAVVAPTAATPASQPPVTPSVTTAPVGPTEKETRAKEEQAAKEAKKAQQKAEKQAAREAKEAQKKADKAAKTASPAPFTETPVVSAPVDTKVEKTQRPKREKTPVINRTDSVAGNTEPTSIRPKREFLPKGHLFDPIILDPLEAQTYGSILPGYWTEGQKYKGSIVPFAFGFAKPFYRRTTEPGRAEEWVLL